MSQELINLIILNNSAGYNLKFAGIAFEKSTTDKYLLVIFSNDDMVNHRQYKSIKSAKIGFAKRYQLISREKNIKPQWSRDLLSYSFQKEKKKRRS